MIFATSNASSAQPALEPGLWRITVTSTTTGKPDPPQDSKQCLGEELQNLPAYFAPQLEGGDAECERTQPPAKDRQLTYRMKCRGADFTVDALTGVTIQNSRHFTMTIQTQAQTAEESATVVAKGEGRRLGACPKQ
jgi:hypothetical protein